MPLVVVVLLLLPALVEACLSSCRGCDGRHPSRNRRSRYSLTQKGVSRLCIGSNGTLQKVGTVARELKRLIWEDFVHPALPDLL